MSLLNVEISQIDKISLKNLKINEKTIIKADAYDVFWNTTFQNKHGTHCFIAKKMQPDKFSIFDPTLNKSKINISLNDLSQMSKNIYTLKLLSNEHSQKLKLGLLKNELENVSKALSQLVNILLNRFRNTSTSNDFVELAKYCDTLVNNRFMFKHYIEKNFEIHTRNFMPSTYFVSWVAVKNVLYKLSLTNDEKTKMQLINLISTLLKNERRYLNELKILDNNF